MAEHGTGGSRTGAGGISPARVIEMNIALCLSVMMEARGVAGDDLTAALLLGGVLGANLDHLDQRPQDTRRHGPLGSVGDEERRPVNSKSLSDALGVPRETTRAKVDLMIDNGLLRRLGHGVILPRSTIQSTAVVAMGAAYFRALEDMISGLSAVRACGLCPTQGLADPFGPIAGSAMRLGVNHVIKTMIHARSLTPEQGCVDTFVLLSVVHLTRSYRHLGRGIVSPDDDLSSLAEPMPVRGHAIAAFLGMPEETVRRHLIVLIDRKRLIRTPRGYDVSADDGFQRQWLDFEDRNVAAMTQFVWRLRQAGVIAPARDQPLPADAS